ncbi:VanZ family protein [Paenibacillus apiarius]|uniref:VanZ family protein n=1 Tax=Paenibacillus apiarius TaxID=46240 RepID=UPI001981C434|nr:VanZ family protein [Paenibacillus apiarius]MBN3523534.1 VanZ family protein [Paenibacillus apiarius]
MNLRNKRAIWWFVLTLLWMGVIFYKSSEPYTHQDLRPTLAAWLPMDMVARWLPQVEFYYDGGLVTWTKPYDFVEFFIRKAAHVTEYAILAFLAIQLGLALYLKRAGAIVLGALFTLLYAMSDEWHQSFVPGRTGHAIDVGVDSIGILLVVTGFLLAGAIGRRNKRSGY